MAQEISYKAKEIIINIEGHKIKELKASLAFDTEEGEKNLWSKLEEEGEWKELKDTFVPTLINYEIKEFNEGVLAIGKVAREMSGLTVYVATLIPLDGKARFFCFNAAEKKWKKYEKEMNKLIPGAGTIALEYINTDRKNNPSELDACYTAAGIKKTNHEEGCHHAKGFWVNLLSHLQPTNVHPTYLEEEPDDFTEKFMYYFKLCGFNSAAGYTVPIMVEGDTGCGKTHTVIKYLEELREKEIPNLWIKKVQIDRNTTVDSFFGTYEVKGKEANYRRGPFWLALEKIKEGWLVVLVLDELYRMKEEQQTALLHFLQPVWTEGRYYYLGTDPNTMEQLKIPADKFMIIGTGNVTLTTKEGYTLGYYHESKPLDDAFLNRCIFLPLHNERERIIKVAKHVLKNKGWTHINPEIFGELYDMFFEAWVNGSVSKYLTVRDISRAIGLVRKFEDFKPVFIGLLRETDLAKRENIEKMLDSFFDKKLKELKSINPQQINIKLEEVKTNGRTWNMWNRNI